MDKIIPRWEWRTFRADFGAADAKFAALEVEAVQESDETYLLSPVTNATVKIRAALMDIKTLVETNEAGLEQWRPVMKESFPIPSAEVDTVCAELGVTPLTPGGESLSLDELLMELQAPTRGVHAVHVHKHRVRYTISGCTSEMTEVVADGTRVRTVAIESEDADRVIAAVQKMGLSHFPNVSYPRWLKAAFDISG